MSEYSFLYRLLVGGISIFFGLILLGRYYKLGSSGLRRQAYQVIRNQDKEKKKDDIKTIFFGIVGLIGGIIVILFGFRLPVSEYFKGFIEFLSL